jgi:DinB superfamily
MRRVQWMLLLVAALASGEGLKARGVSLPFPTLCAQTGTTLLAGCGSDCAALNVQQERAGLQVLLASVRSQIVSAAEAMPADKYGFIPGDGEFKGVRTFGRQVKHLAATNQILAAAALGEAPPTGAGDETGPEEARTKSQIIEYLSDSFAHLGQAIDAIGNANVAVRSSPISPLRGAAATRTALVVEALIHAFDHYGQMVEYLRMNGIVPPASLP